MDLGGLRNYQREEKKDRRGKNTVSFEVDGFLCACSTLKVSKSRSQQLDSHMHACSRVPVKIRYVVFFFIYLLDV